MTTMCNVCCCDIQNPLACPFCDYVFCMRCFKRYADASNEMDIRCMSCRVVWEYKTLKQLFSDSFMKRQHVTRCKQLLFRREELLIPQTVDKAYILKAIMDKKAELEGIKATQKRLRRRIRTERVDMIHAHINEQGAPLDDMTRQERLYLDAYIKVMDMSEAIIALSKQLRESKATVRNKCPECADGYLSEELVCFKCDATVCERCMCAYDNAGTHVCDRDTLETLETMQREGKKCPRCAIFISKQDGCDQMFCVNCHTCFDWNTLNIINRNIQNPHYFANLSKNRMVNPLEFNDEACAMSPKLFFRIFTVNQNHIPDANITSIQSVISRYSKLCFHKNSLESREYSEHNYHRLLMNARMMFIIGEYSKQQYMRKIYDIERANGSESRLYELTINYRNILNLLIQTAFCTLKRYKDNEKFKKSLLEKKFQNSTSAIINEQIAEYNRCVDDIKDEFKLVNANMYHLRPIKMI